MPTRKPDSRHCIAAASYRELHPIPLSYDAGWIPEHGHGVLIELNGRLVHRWAMIEAED